MRDELDDKTKGDAVLRFQHGAAPAEVDADLGLEPGTTELLVRLVLLDRHLWDVWRDAWISAYHRRVGAK